MESQKDKAASVIIKFWSKPDVVRVYAETNDMPEEYRGDISEYKNGKFKQKHIVIKDQYMFRYKVPSISRDKNLVSCL